MKIGKPVSQRYDVNGTSATNDFLELLEDAAILDAPKFSNVLASKDILARLLCSMSITSSFKGSSLGNVMCR